MRSARRKRSRKERHEDHCQGYHLFGFNSNCSRWLNSGQRKYHYSDTDDPAGTGMDGTSDLGKQGELKMRTIRMKKTSFIIAAILAVIIAFLLVGMITEAKVHTGLMGEDDQARI